MKNQRPNSLVGTMMVIFGKGVLLTGKSGSGKSDLALSLLDRGHLFVSDDMIELEKENNRLMACAPSITHPFLLASGIGVINVAKIFGEETTISKHALDLIIQLNHSTKRQPIPDPFRVIQKEKTILAVKIPEIHIPFKHPRNFCILIEVILRNLKLAETGYDASQQFLLKQKKT